VAVLLYIGLREVVLSGHRNVQSEIDNPLQFVNRTTRAFNALSLLGYYVWKIVVPICLSADYSFNHLPVRPLTDPVLWLSALAVMAFFAAGVWFSWRRAPLVALALTLFLLTMAPVANFLPIGTIFAERLAYVPSLAYPLALCALSRTSILSARRPWVFALLGILILVYGARTVVRNADWSDAARMYLRMSLDAPASAKSHSKTADGYVILAERTPDPAEKKRLLEQAEGSVRRALAIQRYDRARAKLGEILLRQGRFREALEELDAVRAKLPDEPLVLRHLGECYLNLGQPQKALVILQNYILKIEEEFGQRDPIGYNFRGLALGMRGNLREALEDFNTAIELKPDVPEIWSNRGHCKSLMEDQPGALEDFKQGLRLSTEKGPLYAPLPDVSAYSMLLRIAPLLEKTGDPAGARDARAQAERYKNEAESKRAENAAANR